VVYKAEDTRLKRNVALKFLSPKVYEVSEERERLLREARAAAGLDHPNVCTVHEIGEAEGQTFIAMAYVRGPDLREKIDDGPLELDEALNVTIQIAEGLQEAHTHGIIHRDVKPANIMVTERGQVKIMDFGLAELFRPGVPCDDEGTSGTVAYMSPEQLRGEAADERSDIWALGVVLYEALTGRRPFEGVYDQAVMYSVLNLEPESPLSLRGDIPQTLERIVMRTLEKDPGRRYQSMHDMVTDLKEVGQGPASVRGTQRSIAVISFENLSGDPTYDFLQRAIPNLLITSLEQSERLRVTTWERLRDLTGKLGREETETIDHELGFELCRLESIDAIVVGSFVKAGDVFATDVKVFDVETKNLLMSSSSRGEGVDSVLMTQIDELSEGIRRSFEAPEEPPEECCHPIAEVTTSSIEAYDLFLKGRDRYESLYNTEARDLFGKAIELDQTFAAAHLYLAWARRRLREPRLRDEALERAKALADRATRRERLYIEAAYARQIEHDSDKEYRILKDLAREYPDEKRVHHRLAGYYRGRKLLYQAVEEYNNVLELDPNYGWAMNELAYMYTDIEDFDRAAELFERYESACPGDANPIDSMGELLFRMGRLDEAIAKYKEALAVKPDFYYAYWEIAYVSALKEDYTEALTWIDAFIERAPSFGTKVEGHRWRCLYHLWLGSRERALEEADRISELASGETSVLWKVEADRMRGWISCARGELDLARGYFNGCLETVDSDPTEFVPTATSYSPGTLEQIPRLRAAYGLALALIDVAEGKLDAARSRLEEIVPHHPDYAELLRAKILLAEGSAEEAITVCERAPQWKTPYMSDTEGMLTYNLPPVTDVLARAYLQKGDIERAVAVYERLLVVDDSTRDRRLIHPLYHHRLAELCETHGLGEKARDQYRRFIELWRGADSSVPELEDAKTRVADLG